MIVIIAGLVVAGAGAAGSLVCAYYAHRNHHRGNK